MLDPNKLSISQLNELCRALGWQGGTYWQMLDEVKRLRRIVDEVQRKPEPSGETMAQREEVCSAWADLPAAITAHPGVKRLYRALGGISPRGVTGHQNSCSKSSSTSTDTDDAPLIEHQLSGLLEGIGASEDHEDSIAFFVKNGISVEAAKRLVAALALHRFVPVDVLRTYGVNLPDGGQQC